MPSLPLLRVLVPFALGIFFEDYFELRPAAVFLPAGCAAMLWRWLPAVLREGALGLSLGALGLALRLHARRTPIGMPIDGTLAVPPSRSEQRKPQQDEDRGAR